VGGVLQAQAQLDTDALTRVTRYMATPQGQLVLPPLWYSIAQVDLSFEMAATLTRISARNAGSSSAAGEVQLDCRLLNPAAVSLFGRSASSGLKIALRLRPQNAEGLRPLGSSRFPPAATGD
jgi:hypothetical protein